MFTQRRNGPNEYIQLPLRALRHCVKSNFNTFTATKQLLCQ